MKTKNVPPPLWVVILLDLLVSALILALLAALRFGPLLLASRRHRAEASERGSGLRVTQGAVSSDVNATVLEALVHSDRYWVIPISASVVAEPTPWQRQFADCFTSEPILTDNSYTSPRLSVTISRDEYESWNSAAAYYVADIYVASPEQFKTTTPYGRMDFGVTLPVEELDAQVNAVVAVNGDFFCLSDSGFYVRNGEIYRRNQPRSDICVLYPDGVMETYLAGSFRVEEILAANPTQVWTFGPALLDENGHVRSELYQICNQIYLENPRSAIGYYEPGHYCFVVVDGRVGVSDGLYLADLAAIFEQLGCTRAYNLDGGASSVLMFNHEAFNVRNSNRSVGDLIVVTDEGFPPAG